MTIPNQPASTGFPGAPTPTPAPTPAPTSTTSTGPSTDATSTSDAAKEQAQQTAGTAADEGKHVAGVAVGEAKQVAGEAKQQAQNLVGEARTQVDAQARTQRDRLVSTLQEFSGQLDGMASGEGAPSGMAQDAVRQVADRTRDLTSRLEGREPSDLLEDVRAYARRRPGTFLLGAMAAGLVAGRLTRGAKTANAPQTPTAAHLGADPVGHDAPSTGAGGPLAGTGHPGTAPVDPLVGARTTQAGTEPARTPGPFDPAPTTGPVTGTDRPDPDVTSTRTQL